MTESVTVLPRFKEQTNPAIPQHSADPIPSESEPLVKGLFTSMYENKIIVIFIVIAIIIIGIIAYVVYKSDDKKEAQKSSPAKTEPSETPSKLDPVKTEPAKPADSPPAKSTPPKEQTPKKDLMDLLKRGKQETEHVEAKTEDEIMSLMEDACDEANGEDKKDEAC